jgi:hypothetical protein
MLLSAQTLLKSFDPLVVQFVPQFDDVLMVPNFGTSRLRFRCMQGMIQ